MEPPYKTAKTRFRPRATPDLPCSIDIFIIIVFQVLQKKMSYLAVNLRTTESGDLEGDAQNEFHIKYRVQITDSQNQRKITNPMVLLPKQ